MRSAFTYRIFPLGDNALTIDFGNCIDEDINREILKRFEFLRENPIPGMLEAVPAYSSLTIYYNVMALRKSVPEGKTVFELMKEQAEKIMEEPVLPSHSPVIHSIPVCYDEMFAPDLPSLLTRKNISKEEAISIYLSRTYRVYMLGFLPGFSYMGQVDERIMMPRKPQPSMVPAGSIGIAGRQTGIYPLATQGGWQIIGRTPLRLFDSTKENPVMLNAGDMVQFTSISKNEFADY